MELISEHSNWCEGGRRSGIDPGDRVSSNASEEEEKEKEAVIEIKANGKNDVYMYLKVFGISLAVKG